MNLSFDTPMGALSVRVGAIILRNDKMLMVRDTATDYLYTVGGRVQYGESTAEAVVRECREETGMDLAIDRLGFVSEICFTSQNLVNAGQLVYELGYYYYMHLPEDAVIERYHFVDGDRDDTLEWVDIDTTEKIHPAYLREELKTPAEGVRHIILDERKYYSAR